ncbi:hypothetical protein BGZ65_009002 [Modicella reniformis]|uniref:Uncharacterized protein n=1 Tax=Modicella reniformis TaxID=1440133 RepID=A0A9P6MEP7_9FUNG|nr:hypothetical protein BGZ65_009002 [Modicella reniformis]
MGANENGPVTQRTIDNLRLPILSEVRNEIQGSINNGFEQIRSAIIQLKHKVVNQQPFQQIVQQPIQQVVPRPTQQTQPATVEHEIMKGLVKPLIEWNTVMRRTDPSRYPQRKLIVDEFEYHGKNSSNMRICHGVALDKINDLIHSIREKRKARELQTPGLKRPRTKTKGKKRAISPDREEEEVEDHDSDDSDDGEMLEEEDEEVEEEEALEGPSTRRRKLK